MTSSIDKSPKLLFNEFQKSISEVPLEVYYQNINSDQYSQNGYQFNIKQPGSKALLDTDIWIKYTIKVRENAAFAIRDMFMTASARANAAIPGGQPHNFNRLAFRSGYVMWRATNNFMLQINNQSITCQPHKYNDVLNRLYVSQDQSEHEFSGSGGPFDSGNHSNRTHHVMLTEQDVQNYVRSGGIGFLPNSGDQVFVATPAPAPGNFGIVGNDGDPVTNNTYLFVSVCPTWHPGIATGDNRNRHLYTNCRPTFPLVDEFYNPGFSRRTDIMAEKLRYWDLNNNVGATAGNADGQQFTNGQVEGVGQQVITMELWERLPITIFKMYSNDSTFGVIPNIKQMQIQGNFSANLVNNIFRQTPAQVATLSWTDIGATHCVLYLKWYTPPMNMPIPMEISIPYPKIVTYAKSLTFRNYGANTNFYIEQNDQEYNITLESIPDLLLIYFKLNGNNYAINSPDDYLMEITNLSINIDNASGKLNQINTWELYNKWKKILKHQDNKITGYDEWRKFCCVAALQPEDYGVRYGPGYSNQTVLGVVYTIRNWHNIPSINYEGRDDLTPTGVAAHANGEMCVVAIYNRSRLIIRSDGTAAQDMLKVAADFNMITSVGQAAEVLESRNRLNL